MLVRLLHLGIQLILEATQLPVLSVQVASTARQGIQLLPVLCLQPFPVPAQPYTYR